ncbi:MAG TPA: rhodanese-like domain-containing protein [Gammaproteobacteria bacterium]|nr:rhodanese-like domain-containing protein [Gammaproteobacteria bacterium]
MKKLVTGIFAAGVLSATALLVPASALAVDVMLTDYLAYLQVIHDGQPVRVERIQDQEHMLSDGFAKTSRKCPPFCIQPMKVAPGVITIGEAEIFRFMDRQLAQGTGLIIDARTPSWYEKGTIPGSINIPFTVFSGDASEPETSAALEKIGGVRRGEVGTMTRKFEQAMAPLGMFGADAKTDSWDFTNAKELVLWCNGPWCGQSPRAIKGLIDHGFPPGKISYYRGGMQMWKILGLTVVVPDGEKSVALK